MDNLYWFKSSVLKVIQGEDEETNPNRFGKGVASWIAEAFKSEGYKTEVFAEDWGWRVDCMNEPCPIWIGCGNVDEMDDDGKFLKPKLDDIVWHCFVEADAPFLKKLFGKIDPSTVKLEVAQIFTKLLEQSDHITQVEEP